MSDRWSTQIASPHSLQRVNRSTSCAQKAHLLSIAYLLLDFGDFGDFGDLRRYLVPLEPYGPGPASKAQRTRLRHHTVLIVDAAVPECAATPERTVEA